MPPGVEAEDPLLEPAILVAGGCSCCKQYFNSEDLKYCTACKTGGPYCGKTCLPGQSLEVRTQEAMQEEQWTQKSRCLSIGDIAREGFEEAGPGVMVLHLEHGTDLEQFIVEIQTCVTGTQVLDFDGIGLPEIVYVEYPFKYPSPFGPFDMTKDDLQRRFKALDMDSFMKNLTMSQYALGITVGTDPTLHLISFEQNTTGIPKSTKLVSSISRGETLRARIETNAAFSQCREFMGKFKVRPGVVWIRNIFDHDRNYFERTELEKVTPELLLKDLIQHQVDMGRQAMEFSCACRFVSEDGTGGAANEDFGGECPAWWLAFVEDRLEDITDPNTLVGYFETALFSNSDSISSQIFTFKLS
ncbi:unnamed protein product [Cylindrotheca closterium]|uniref:Uncharacterized protein n=1 Tax=Cylindrotheca closterium TaxID=2856 RepID=A0AAD2CL49_9STRA|nr:unnamed protein product [Cylindrotheca closterium]